MMNEINFVEYNLNSMKKSFVMCTGTKVFINSVTTFYSEKYDKCEKSKIILRCDMVSIKPKCKLTEPVLFDRFAVMPWSLHSVSLNAGKSMLRPDAI